MKSAMVHEAGRFRAAARFCWGLLFLCAFCAAAASDHVQRSVQLLQRGDLPAAEAEARAAVEDPSTKHLGYALLGAIRLRQGRLDESVQVLRQALQIEPALVGAQLNLGRAYALQGNAAEARAALQRVLELDPQNRDARYHLFQLEIEAGRHGAALEAAQPILPALKRSPQGLFSLAAAYLAAGRRGAAAGLANDWQRLAEPPAEVAVPFAALLHRDGLTDSALRVLEAQNSSGPASAKLETALGGLYLAKGRAEKAAAAYDRALAINSGSVPALVGAAQAAENQGQLEKALAYLIRAKRKAPENPDVLLSFGLVCLKLNLVLDAKEALQEAVSLRPGHRQSVHALASALVGNAEYKAALPLLQDLLRNEPDDPTLHYGAGAVLYLQSRFDEAARHLQKSVELDPQLSEAYYYLGLTKERAGDRPEAIRLFRNVLERRPNHAGAQASLGAALFHEGEHGEAERALRRAIELDPESVKAHYQLGLLLMRQGEREAAREYIEAAEKLREEEKSEPNQLRLLNPH